MYHYSHKLKYFKKLNFSFWFKKKFFQLTRYRWRRFILKLKYISAVKFKIYKYKYKKLL